MIRIFFILPLVLIVSFSQAQYKKSGIATARPGHTPGTFTPGKGIFQVQTGLRFNQYAVQQGGYEGENAEYLMSMRYGLFEIFELRAAFQLSNNEFRTNDIETINRGLSSMIVGGRVNLANGRGTYKPSVAFQADVNLNVLSEDYNPEKPGARATFLYGQRVAQKLQLNTALGVRGNGNGTTIGFYGVKFTFPVGEKFESFIEDFGTLRNNDLDHRIGTGLGYFVSKDLKLDLSFAIGRNDQLNDYLLDIGFSWRTKRKS